MDFIENEIKVLGIADPSKLQSDLLAIGAKKVSDEVRTITHFCPLPGIIIPEGTLVKLTEEGGKVKYTTSKVTPEGETKEVKALLPSLEHGIAQLEMLGLAPATKVKAQRISFELGKVDFDIDLFPDIPPFLEIDIEHYQGDYQDLLLSLGFEQHQIFRGSTPDVFAEYGIDYFKAFAL